MARGKHILTRDECLKFLAKQIIKSGESKHKAEYGLVPSDFVQQVTKFNLISDHLFNTEKITHYDVVWDIPLKTVILTLYKGDCFGACLNLEHYQTLVIDITDSI